MRVQSLGREDPLEEEMATSPEFLPGQRSLVGYSPWGGKESDTTECLSLHMGLTPYFYWSSFVEVSPDFSDDFMS